MHPLELRRAALGLLETGLPLNAVSKRLGVSRAALREWRELPDLRGRGRAAACPRGCDGGGIESASLTADYPQHGPGRKHERVLGMQPWQWALVEEHPGDFLRGLFHSDGARVNNWATRMVAGERKRYDYPRWQFVNASEEILGPRGGPPRRAGRPEDVIPPVPPVVRRAGGRPGRPR